MSWANMPLGYIFRFLQLNPYGVPHMKIPKYLLPIIALGLSGFIAGCGGEDAELEAASFTESGAFEESDTSAEIKSVSTTSDAFESERYSYNGTINGKLAIEMNFEVAEDRSVSGEYWYTKKRIPIELRGTIKEGTVSLEEYSEGARTGIFSGSYTTPNLITGTWSAPDGSKTFPFTLAGTIDNTSIEMDEADDSYDQTTSAKTSGGYDIDKYLDDYERYMLKVVKVMHNMGNNNPAAATEYMEAMEDAQQMSEKLAGMEDEMEPRHVERMMEISRKLNDAASKVR